MYLLVSYFKVIIYKNSNKINSIFLKSLLPGYRRLILNLDEKHKKFSVSVEISSVSTKKFKLHTNIPSYN